RVCLDRASPPGELARRGPRLPSEREGARGETRSAKARRPRLEGTAFALVESEMPARRKIFTRGARKNSRPPREVPPLTAARGLGVGAGAVLARFAARDDGGDGRVLAAGGALLDRPGQRVEVRGVF